MAAAGKSLKTSALLGMLWGALGGLAGKLASFAAQIVLGWLLSKEDFGLYAVASSCAAFAGCLNNGGTHRILVCRGADYPRLARPVLRISLAFNLLVAGLLAALAGPAGDYYRQPELGGLLVLMGLATVLATPGYVFHAKLQSELRFGLGQILAVCSLVVRHGGTVAFAYLGFGARAFVLPLVLIAVTDSLLARWAAGALPPKRPFDWADARSVLKDSKWVMLGSLAGALVLNGDNLAVSWTGDMALLGAYFFAFQLTFSVASLLGGSLQSVLMPAFARIADDPARRRGAFARAVSAMALAATLLSFGLAVLAGPLVHWAWAGKWDEAVPVVQILSLSLPLVLVAAIGRAAAEAAGGWATTTALSIAEGACTLLAALLGASLGGLAWIALAVALVKCLAGLAQTAAAARLLGGEARRLAAPVLAPLLLGLAALAAAALAGDFGNFALPALPSPGAAGAALAYLAVFLAAAPWLCRQGWGELRALAGAAHGKLAARK